MKIISTILLSLSLLILPVLMYGQQPDTLIPQSKVVMSEADISSLVTILLKSRAAKAQVVSGIAPASSQAALYMPPTMYDSGNSDERLMNELSLENTLLKLHLTLLQEQITNKEQITNRPPVVQGQGYPVFPDTRGDDSQRIRDIQNEISRLQNRVSELAIRRNTAPIIGNTSPIILYDTGQSALKESIVTTPIPIPIPIPVPTDTAYSKKGLAAMEQKIDSLIAVIQSTSQIKVPEVISYSSKFDSLQQELVALKKEMIANKEVPTDYDLLKAKFTDYKKEIYFSNNSAKLDINAIQTVEELKNLLEVNNNLDVVLKGFASDKGAPAYNEKLSMQRTETIKQMLTQEGIHPTRVLTQYHGIDYNASSESEARRVVVSILVRK